MDVVNCIALFMLNMLYNTAIRWLTLYGRYADNVTEMIQWSSSSITLYIASFVGRTRSINHILYGDQKEEQLGYLTIDVDYIAMTTCCSLHISIDI